MVSTIPSQDPAVAATADIFWAARILGCWFPEDSKIKHTFKCSYSWWMVLYTSLNCQAVLQHRELPACRVKDGELRSGSEGAEGLYFKGSTQERKKSKGWAELGELLSSGYRMEQQGLQTSLSPPSPWHKNQNLPLGPSAQPTFLLTSANTHHGVLRNPRNSMFNFQNLI